MTALRHVKCKGIVSALEDGSYFCPGCSLATTAVIGGNSETPPPEAPSTEAIPSAPPTPPPPLALLLGEVRAFVRKYLVLSDAQADTIALWVAHTHAFDAAEATPYLAITSAEKRSGKTQLLEVLSLLVKRPWLTGRASPAALYRKIHAERPTLLLDESDSAFKSGEEYGEALRGILNTGHRQGGSTTVCVGQGANLTYCDFSTFSPKAIAGIGLLPDTVADRSIAIVLQRKAPGEKVARFSFKRAGLPAEPIREALEAWSVISPELADTEPDTPESLDDRARDGWEVLLAIADLAGEEWPRHGRTAAVELSVGRDDESEGVKLLADIRSIFTAKGDPDKLTSAILVHDLVEIEESPWGDLRGRQLDARGLARRLKPFNVRPQTIRLSETQTAKGYLRESLVDEWVRYLPPPTPESPSQASHRNKTADTDTGDCYGVTDVTANTGTGERAE